MLDRKIDFEKFVLFSCGTLSNYIECNNLKSVVIGLSGGIDSTVSAYIASIACKMAHVPLIGRSLPCSTNKKEEREAASLVGNALCNDFKEVPIDGMYEYLLCDLTANEGELNNVQKGNIKARIRMIYLRNLASLKGGIVLDNDNFSEYCLGFWTIGGDSPMDYNVGLHHLYKTEVYELAEFILKNNHIRSNEDWSKALEASMKLVPTDGNGVSNSDCEQFGLESYKEVDEILYSLYNKIPSAEELQSLYDKYGNDKVLKIGEICMKTEYKRNGAPVFPQFDALQFSLNG